MAGVRATDCRLSSRQRALVRDAAAAATVKAASLGDELTRFELSNIIEAAIIEVLAGELAPPGGDRASDRARPP
jgi:hypothetical protein